MSCLRFRILYILDSAKVTLDLAKVSRMSRFLFKLSQWFISASKLPFYKFLSSNKCFMFLPGHSVPKPKPISDVGLDVVASVR